MALSTTHTNVAQEQRFWSHSEKYDGLHGSFLLYVVELRKEMTFQQSKLNEKTRQFKVVGRAIKYLTIIHNNQLSSKNIWIKVKLIENIVWY